MLTRKEKQQQKILKNLEKAIAFKNDKERLEFLVYTIQSDFMALVQELMNRKKYKPSDLAREMNVKRPFISQLFSGDKRINFTHLAKIQEIFQDKIVFSSYSLNMLKINATQENHCKIIPMKVSNSFSSFPNNNENIKG